MTQRMMLVVLLCGLTWTPLFGQVTLESLLEEMVDRDRTARLPSPAYTCRQASSYDRDAVSPAEQQSWYANWDRSQFVRVEQRDGRKEYVLMDAEGPGAVVRFWATWHGPRGKPFSNGTLRVYLDGRDQPAIEGPIADLIDGGLLVGPPLAEGVSPKTDYKRRGHNLYLPIPYAAGCKITYSTTVPIDRGAKTGEALYYQINFRTYAPGTRVEPFSLDALKQAKPLVDKTQAVLAAGSAPPQRTPGDRLITDQFVGEIAPGESESATLAGPAAVRRLVLRLEADDLEQALRSTVLEIAFDGRPAVWVPVGDFAGIGYRVRPYHAWYTRVDEDGTMSCSWVMPFERSCNITLRNLGEQTVNVVRADVHFGPWPWDGRSMYFHAAWHQLTKIDTRNGKGMNGQGAFDVNYVEAKGQGVFVGDTLTLFNGADAWWGEGDEKIYVDGEPFPSHFGTGTEDYYGYAWCRPEFFQSPFHAQPDGGGNLKAGFSVNSRYRLLDAIPFAKSIKFDMELWHWRGTTMNFAPTTFWYARPGATSNIAADPETAALPVARKRADVVEVFRVPGAIEGETLRIIEKTGGVAEVQDAAQFHWSNGRQLWWRDAKVGDRLVLEFPIEKAGTYRVTAALTKANDYGIAKLMINGTDAGSFDRYHAQVLHDPLPLGTFQLKAGTNRLEVEITGNNEKAIKRQMFGLDYLKVEAVGR